MNNRLPCVQVANQDHRPQEKAVWPEDLEHGPCCPRHWANPPEAYPGLGYPHSSPSPKPFRSPAGTASASSSQTQHVLVGSAPGCERTQGEPAEKEVGKKKFACLIDSRFCFSVICYVRDKSINLLWTEVMGLSSICWLFLRCVKVLSNENDFKYTVLSFNHLRAHTSTNKNSHYTEALLWVMMTIKKILPPCCPKSTCLATVK